MKSFAAILGLSIVLLGASARAADKVPLNEALPHDTLAFVEIDPAAAGIKPAGTGLIDLGLRGLSSLGVVPEAGAASDVMGIMGEMSTRRTCFAMLDAELVVKPDPRAVAMQGIRGGADRVPGILECKSIQLVWVMETDRPRAMVDRLTRLLANYATQETARQSVRKTAESGKEYVEFYDTRWPEWMRLGWMQQTPEPPATGVAPGTAPAAITTTSGRFVLTLGAGAMEHYLADRPVGDVPWKQGVAGVDAERARMGVAHEGELLGRVYVAAKSFREKYPEAMARTMLSRLFGAMELGQAEGSVLTARVKEKSVGIFTGTQVGGRYALTSWTVPLPADAAILRAVPEDATGYAVLNVQWPALYERLMALCDAVVTDPTDVPVAQQAAEIAKKAGVDIRKDILDRLQPWVVVHDSPRHPLGVPLMVTGVGATQLGSEEKVKEAMGKMTAGIAEAVDRKRRGPPGAAAPAEDLSRVRVRTDPDGTNYLQFGIVGPGWGWVGNRLVVSWSPASVRMNAPAAGKVTGTAFGPER